MDIDQFLPGVLRQVTGCPDLTAWFAIREVAIDFTKRTRLWREDDTITLSSSSNQVDLDPPSGAEIYEIQTLTMQGRMSRWIVSALPLGIILVLQVENPHYLHPLVASTGGKIVFALAAIWAVAGSFAIKRIVEIEV